MVAILTIEQKDSLMGVKFDGIQYFYPVQDANGDWVISEQEINQCTNVDYQWVKSLTLSVFNPPVIIDPLV